MAKAPQVSQPVLFPLPHKAVWVQPGNLGTADCQMVCRCDDSCEYAVKDKKNHPHTPHAEWFCTHLASLVGIPGPVCEIIALPDGSTAFGSRWHDGALPSRIRPSSPPPWWNMIQTNQIPVTDVRIALTRIYAFDHFVHNYDRHAGNFLVVKQKSGHAVLAFDYSRAWTFHGFPPPKLPFNSADPNEKTVRLQRQLKPLIGDYIDAQAAKQFLDVLKQVPVSEVEKIVSDHPQDWLDAKLRDKIYAWWSSQEMSDRIDGITMGIGNGTYL